MAFGPYVLADPQSKLNFTHDWADYLAQGETIATHLWSISPLNSGSPTSPVLTGTTTDTVFVYGMLPGRIYHLVEHITTNSGIEDERTVVIRCENA